MRFGALRDWRLIRYHSYTHHHRRWSDMLFTHPRWSVQTECGTELKFPKKEIPQRGRAAYGTILSLIKTAPKL